MHWRQVARQALQRRAPHTRNHIYYEGKYHDSQSQTAYADVLNLAVVSKAELAQEVEAKECEYHNPDCKVDLAVEQSPAVSLVGGAQELEAESNLDKSEYNLHRVEPATALWHLLQHRREECKECKWQCKGGREGQHRKNWRPDIARARSSINNYHTYDWACTRERYKHQCQGHKEDTQDTALLRLCITLVYELAWQGNLESTEERRCKYHKYSEENQVREPVCRNPVEDVGSDCIASRYMRDNDKYGDWQCVECHDKCTIQRCVDSTA